MGSRAVIALLLIFLSQALLAQDLGNYGKVFDVIERDIKEVILERLNRLKTEGSLDSLEHKLQEEMAKRITRPKPVLLTPTRNPKTFYVNPGVVLNNDITTPDGKLVAQKGASINPFDYVTYRKTFFFFDADDKAQVAWVKNHYKDYEFVKFILIKGDIRDASESLGRIYFDMNGTLSHYFHLKYVPSVVLQEEKHWKIQEIGASDA